MGREQYEINQLDITGRLKYVKPVFDDFRFNSTGINPPGQAADPVWDVDEIGWNFTGARECVLSASGQLTHGYKPETDLQPHVHIYPTAMYTGGAHFIALQLSVKRYKRGEPVPSGWTFVEKLQVDVGGLFRESLIVPFSSIDMTGYGESTMVKWELRRIPADAFDNYASDVILDELDFHIELDKLGTETDNPTI